jgi:CubicO group peptidase (beta-lactamase class C family)
MFTALGLALLVEEGKVAFDTPLERFFPDLGDATWRRTATVGHLLSHTSGVVEYWNPETDEALTHTASLAEIFPFVKQAGTRFTPGEECEYSNSNFILAGMVIEMVSGMDYYNFVRERILLPSAMKDTDSYRTDGSAANLAIPLTGERRAWTPTRRGLRGSSAGGGYTTARDMLRFSRRLVAGRIVTREMLAEMARSHTDRIPDTQLDYGYGFIREQSADRVPSFGHGGFARGVNFEYRYFPTLDITLVAYCNQDNGAYDSLRKTVTKLITGER